MTRPGRFLLAALLIVGLGATACSKKPPAAEPPPPPPPAVTPAPPPPPPPPPPPAPPAPAPLTEEQIFANKTVDQLNAEKPFADAFFDYDKYNIRDDQLGALQKDAEWLKRWSSVKITIEGHCDSRGTSEYNLALGERRANAVKSYLAGLGVAPDRMTTISKGKEQPFCTEENESCWAQNRRGHFVVTAK